MASKEVSRLIWTVLPIAVALGMDAFAVSVASGMTVNPMTGRHVFRMSWHFGLFQALMPLLGWAAGQAVASRIQAWDHWVAFAILAGISCKMIWDALREDHSGKVTDPTRGWTLVALSVGTSIDALAVGLSFSLLNVPIIWAAVCIGITASLMSLAGLWLGRRARAAWDVARMANTAGALVLLAVGLHILWDHGVF